MYIAGLKTMWNTMKVLRKEEPAVQRYLYGYVFLASAMASFTNLAITYLSQQVRMNATEIVIFILLNLLINPLGVLVHRIVANRIGHKKNYLLVNSFTLILAGLWTGIIAGPDQKPIAYLFAALFGIAYGWYYPSSNGFYVSIVPKEKVMELWGFNMFMSTILSWGPPLLFTVLNEATGDIRLGMLGLISFQIIGIFFACFIPVDKEETPGKTTPIPETSSVQQSA
jgi:MFS-type transporter involved in bile tolerance (Atg22 family)